MVRSTGRDRLPLTVGRVSLSDEMKAENLEMLSPSPRMTGPFRNVKHDDLVRLLEYAVRTVRKASEKLKRLERVARSTVDCDESGIDAQLTGDVLKEIGSDLNTWLIHGSVDGSHKDGGRNVVELWHDEQVSMAEKLSEAEAQIRYLYDELESAEKCIDRLHIMSGSDGLSEIGNDPLAQVLAMRTYIELWRMEGADE